ncbi:GGDEF domain-containing protein [Streptomyces sp. A7024]|uniref:GGDEF domain-containing protein n=1 Tax=Streptomyces coryli TaxID=1128680 RepID=A0A6G4TVA0_9ACTN|nr:GGDEF domain-containing protein [Streptomyces coryli]NGN63743.1 GGDEF domain-containing protein [Streptomyces coryli]
MAAAVTHRDALRAAAEAARGALGGSFAAICVWERERGRLRVLVNAGERAPGEEEFPEDESYAVHDFPEIAGPDGGAQPRPWVVTADGDSPRAAALARRRRGSCVIAPVIAHGRAWGELYVARPVGARIFTAAEADFAGGLAAVVAAGVAQTERLEEARRLAFTDPLTGLANRRAVDATLQDAIRRHRGEGTVVTLAVCDLNGLKQVNDSLGHASGDRLLERFGSLLSLYGASLPGTLAARLGGDEFCLLAVGPSADEVVRAAEELCVRAAELELGEGVACGIASTGDPIGPVRSARRLFRLADAAQYQAKAARAAKPVVAGRDEKVVHLADTAPDYGEDGERRSFRGRC